MATVLSAKPEGTKSQQQKQQQQRRRGGGVTHPHVEKSLRIVSASG